MSSKLRTLLFSIPLLTLTACATPTPTPVTSAPPVDLACSEFPRMTFDRLKDTDATIAEIKAYDAGRDKLCGVGK